MTEKSNSKPSLINVAVDDGYAQTKLVGECPKTGEMQKHTLRSSIRTGRSSLGGFGGGGIGLYSTEEGEYFTVSEEIESENTQFDGFHVSAMNRVLVNHSLINAGYGGCNIRLVTGLPVADYYMDDERDGEHIEAKKENLKKAVTASSGEPMPVIGEVRIGCQAVAAWFDYVLDDNLKQVNDSKGRVAIVDIGGRTTDIAVVIGGAAIDHASSGTANIGVLDVYKTFHKELRKFFGIKTEFPLEQIDIAVRTGKMKLWNKEQDVSEIVEGVVREHESQIAREVERRIGSAANLAAVVFVGGGSALFRSIAGRFPNGHMPDDPEFSNAKGLYKYMKVKP